MKTSSSNEITRRANDDRSADVSALVPPVDVSEDATGITVLADMPGASREGLHINVDADTLTIEAQFSLGEAPETRPIYTEVRTPSYRRSFTLSRELDTTRIDASLKDGVLKLRVPKLEEARPRRIEVRAE
jgi:HSP20 family molecular chaperone IbpA